MGKYRGKIPLQEIDQTFRIQQELGQIFRVENDLSRVRVKARDLLKISTSAFSLKLLRDQLIKSTTILRCTVYLRNGIIVVVVPV